MRARHGLVVLALTACAAHAVTPPIPPPVAVKAPAAVAVSRLVSVDVFDPDPEVADRILAALEPELRRFGDTMIDADADAIRTRIRKFGDFASIEFSRVGDYTPDGMKYYLTVDLVEQRDAARRIAFTAAPHGTYADPAGLLADQEIYETRVTKAFVEKRMSLKPVACPVFHCFGDPTHPDVRELSARFAAEVPKHADELATILRDDANAEHRSDVPYLLAYTADGERLVELLVPAIRDPSMMVRNNVMRVLAEIAKNHPDVKIPIEPLLDALEFPRVTDRNKAAATIDRLLDHPDAARLRATIAARGGVALLAMLRLQQPNNHEYAYKILQKISGQTFGERDYGAWQTWLATTR